MKARHHAVKVPLLRQWLRDKVKQHHAAITGWKELDWYLIPTEPDRETRDRIIASLAAAIQTLEQVDDYICDYAGIPEGDR